MLGSARKLPCSSARNSWKDEYCMKWVSFKVTLFKYAKNSHSFSRYKINQSPDGDWNVLQCLGKALLEVKLAKRFQRSRLWKSLNLRKPGRLTKTTFHRFWPKNKDFSTSKNVTELAFGTFTERRTLNPPVKTAGCWLFKCWCFDLNIISRRWRLSTKSVIFLENCLSDQSGKLAVGPPDIFRKLNLNKAGLLWGRFLPKRRQQFPTRPRRVKSNSHHTDIENKWRLLVWGQRWLLFLRRKGSGLPYRAIGSEFLGIQSSSSHDLVVVLALYCGLVKSRSRNLNLEEHPTEQNGCALW